VLFETWLVPIEGWFVDKYGPRLVVLRWRHPLRPWLGDQRGSDQPQRLLSGNDVAGIGAGGVYGTCVGNALKWFPDKRGLAAGITAAGFWRRFSADGRADPGDDQGFPAFKTRSCTSGSGKACFIVLFAFFPFRAEIGPGPCPIQSANIMQTRRNYLPTEVMRHPIFWLMLFHVRAGRRWRT